MQKRAHLAFDNQGVQAPEDVERLLGQNTAALVGVLEQHRRKVGPYEREGGNYVQKGGASAVGGGTGQAGGSNRAQVRTSVIHISVAQ